MNSRNQKIILALLLVLIGMGIYLTIKVNQINQATLGLEPVQNSSIQTPQQEQDACTNTFGPNAFLRDASTGYCGCNPGYTAMYLGKQGEQCVDPSNVLLIPSGNNLK